MIKKSSRKILNVPGSLIIGNWFILYIGNEFQLSIYDSVELTHHVKISASVINFVPPNIYILS